MDTHLRARLQAACGLLALALSSACGGAAEEEVGEERLGEALRLALRYGCLRADAVRHLLHYLSTPRTPAPRMDLRALGLEAPSVPMRDVAVYNQLLART